MSALPGGTAPHPARLTVAEDPVAPVAPGASAPTSERLLFAAREVVEANGYGGASVAAIALRAGVANGTLYRHFGSKAELFVEVFRDVCGREVAAMRAAVDAAGADHVARVLAPLDLFARRALQNRTLAWALLAEPVDAQVDEVRLEYRRTYRELLSGVLREAIDAGALPLQDPELTAAALVGAVGEALVGPVSAARGPVSVTVGGPRRAAAYGADDPARGDGDPDRALLTELGAVCRRATGAAATVRADASGEPR